jgi:glutamate-5-semialdehyde dehydrogenase
MTTTISPIRQQIIALGQQARLASRTMATANAAQKNQALEALAKLIDVNRAVLKAANTTDIDRASKAGQDPAFIDRLTLSDKAINTMVDGIRQIVALNDPIGSIGEMVKRDQAALTLGKMRVPLGVIGIIYESRPNVTVDAAALCIKAGNATVLRGGSEAIESNRALADLITPGAAVHGPASKLAFKWCPQQIVRLSRP